MMKTKFLLAILIGFIFSNGSLALAAAEAFGYHAELKQQIQELNKIENGEEFHLQSDRIVLGLYNKILNDLSKSETEYYFCGILQKLTIDELITIQPSVEELFAEGIGTVCQYSVDFRVSRYWLDQRIAMNSLGFQISDGSITFPVATMTLAQTPSDRVYDGNNFPDKHIMLTFDDGPKQGTTEAIVRTLGGFGAKAVFFSMGRRAKAYPKALKVVADAGHHIGSHSMNHPPLMSYIGKDLNELKKTFIWVPREEGTWEKEDSLNEVLNGHWSVFKAAGIVDPFFRPPYGEDFNNNSRYIRNQVIDQGLHNFRWNLDSFDWKERDPKALLAYTIGKIQAKGRGILLMHDVQDATSLMLPYLLKWLSDNNYTLVLPERGQLSDLQEDAPVVKNKNDKANFFRTPKVL